MNDRQRLAIRAARTKRMNVYTVDKELIGYAYQHPLGWFWKTTIKRKQQARDKRTPYAIWVQAIPRWAHELAEYYIAEEAKE